ncbi:toll-like receptor 13 [Coregonus clupeaformis]|uniref:toll-like receptor 13 n=1 Tax=Coregonus clupeaformis TaxID=59861 RepID=UPI001E1C8124|nr:toll-like receptor 13 [Coregonus clupeaformis]
MTGLHKLETLNLAGNKLSSIRQEEFKGVASLKTLLLFDNQIASMEDGAFEGLVNLTELKMGSNKIPQIDIRKTVLSGLTCLTTLDISCNCITYVNDDKLNPPPFSHLTSLENLHIHSPRRKGLSHLPINFLEGLKSLLAFKAGNLNIKDLHPDTFIHTPRLWFLDISKNEFTALTPKLFHPTPRLNRMYLSKARLQSLDFLIGANLSRVTFLQVSKNDITVVNETVLRYLPALTYLDMQDNAFTCGCSDAWFVQWMESDNQTQVDGAGEFTCNYPAELKGTKLLDVELQFCTVHLGLYYYISTTSLVLLNLIASFAYHFLKWQVIYGYYLFLAFLYDTKQRNKRMPHGCQYDTFISYNAHDEPWVLRELLPELEGEQGWKLCLHHRDFQPGKPIIEKIMDGIYGSRKTICLISHRYLESEWCSREIQVASFRLFDEKKDVLILVFLEEIHTHQLSPYHRMRKLVKRRSYLSWPRAGEHTGVFWQQLRLALETKDSPAEENPILSGVEAL